MTTDTCICCKQTLPLTDFHTVHKGKYRRHECKKCFLKNNKPRRQSWEKRNRKYRAEYAKTLHRRLRIEALLAYGGKCVKCGQRELKYLTFDHINNDGAKHRKRMPSTQQFIMWLKRQGWPKTIQILCWNCNCSKQFWGEND